MRAVLALLFALLTALPAQAAVKRWLTGSAVDVTLPMHGPMHDLGGGSTDVDAALQAMIDGVRGCTDCAATVDVVILRSGGADGYNDYIYAMNGVDSVETLLIRKRADADTDAVEATVSSAEVVFFAGGDQCDYIRFFRGTRVETAVEAVYAAGGGVGGTSAGMAIQGEITYDACRASATSADILADPYHRSATFSDNFFDWANLGNTITDQHFVARDRMGRLMGFLARQIADGVKPSVLGVAADERTSIVVDAAGLATVMGSGNAYFVLADHAPELCAAGQPLSYSGYKIWRVAPGETFDLHARPTTGYYSISVDQGVLSGNPY